jgi:hypothetical protein
LKPLFVLPKVCQRISAILLLLLPTANLFAQATPSPRLFWWKGNVHTHTFWSDGDDYPEMVVDWYKRQGYHFLALSDHNILQQGEKWVAVTTPKALETLRKYRQRFGLEWVEQRTLQYTQQVRLKTLASFRSLFEEPERFLLIQSEEITDKFLKADLHLNATNLRDFIRPAGGTSVLDVIQRNVNAVLEQGRRTGQPMFPHINHPNFSWAITAEDLMQVQGERFFEVYNGHPTVHNDGDARRPSTERLWDIALSFRLSRLGLGPFYGLAVDDAHNYHWASRTNSNPGRGWVMVRAAELTPAALIAAMESGDFYASSGVRLREIWRSPRHLAVQIEPEPGVTYLTRFIGTRRNFDPRSQSMALISLTDPPLSHRYSADIGVVLSEVPGLIASYVLRGDELYVRAKVISSKPKANSTTLHETEAAWTQPLVAGK